MAGILDPAMLRITELKLPLDHPDEALREAIVQRLGIRDEQLLSFNLFKRSYDARKKNSELLFIYTIDLQASNEAELLAKSADMLGIPLGTMEEALRIEIENTTLTVGNGEDNEPWVYLAVLDLAEREVAARLAEIEKERHPSPQIDLPAAVEWVQKQLNMQLAEGQKQAFFGAFKHKVLVITGGPGVGDPGPARDSPRGTRRARPA